MKFLSRLSLLIVTGICAVSMSYAQAGKMWIGPAGGLNIPLGSDFQGIGFSFTALFKYDINEKMSVGGEAGYATWAGKSVEVPFLGTIDGPSTNTIPIRAFFRYYFMPSPTPSITALRLYGHVTAGVNIGTASGAGASFETFPQVGVEYPLAGGGRTQLDASVGYYGVFASGATLSNLGLRVGVNFAIN